MNITQDKENNLDQINIDQDLHINMQDIYDDEANDNQLFTNLQELLKDFLINKTENMTKDNNIYEEIELKEDQKILKSKALKLIDKCTKVCHEYLKDQQYKELEISKQKVEDKNCITLEDKLSGEIKQKRDIFTCDYKKIFPIITALLKRLEDLYDSPVTMDKTAWKNQNPTSIPRDAYFDLSTGLWEELKVVYHKFNENGDNEIVDLKGFNTPIIKGRKFSEKELSQETVGSSLKEEAHTIKLLTTLNDDLEFTYNNFFNQPKEKQEKLKILFGRERINKDNSLKIKDQDIYLEMDVSELYNMFVMLFELDLAFTQVKKHKLFSDWNEKVDTFERIMSKPEKDRNADTIKALNEYFKRRQADNSFTEIFEGKVKVKLTGNRLSTSCLTKKMHNTGYLLHLAVDKTAKIDDASRVHYMIENIRTGKLSDIYVIKKSEITKKMKDIIALLCQSCFYPKHSFQWIMLTNYVLKPTDEKETLMGLDHFISTPDSQIVGTIKLFEQMEKGKYSVHRNTNDVLHLILQYLRDGGKTRKFNHSGTIFQPRKRSGNEVTLLQMMTDFWKHRDNHIDEKAYQNLLYMIKSGKIFEDYGDSIDQMRDDFRNMREVTGSSLMGTKASNRTTIIKDSVKKVNVKDLSGESDRKDCYIFDGKYHSALTVETIAEYCGNEVTHLNLSNILERLEDKCLIRIFIKEMMGGMRDIAILTPQWKVACAVTEEICKRISKNLSNDLIQKEENKPKIITNKIKTLMNKYYQKHKEKGKLLVVEVDFSKWNAHQDTSKLMEVSGSILDFLFTTATTGGLFLRTIGDLYKRKLMQVELSRIENTILTHIALEEGSENGFLLTKRDLETIEDYRRNKYKLVEASVCPLSAQIFEILKASKTMEPLDWRKKIVAIPVEHGMGQGIMSTGSSIYCCLVYRMILPFIKRSFNIEFSDYVVTSDDGNIYFILPPKHPLFRLDVQQKFASRFNELVGSFGLSINQAKMKFSTDGTFTFNSSDHTILEGLSNGKLTIQECINRWFKGYGGHEYTSPFTQFLKYNTWIIFISKMLDWDLYQTDRYITHFRNIMDLANYNFVKVGNLSLEQSKVLYSTVTRIKINGHYYLTNRSEAHVLMSFNESVECDGRIDMRKLANISRQSKSALGFTFKNPRFITRSKINRDELMKYAANGGVNTQLEIIKHFSDSTSAADRPSGYFRTLYSGWIAGRFENVAPQIGENDVPLSQLSMDLMTKDLRTFKHLYSFTCEDNSDIETNSMNLTQELFLELISNVRLSNKTSEKFILIMNSMKEFVLETDVKRLSTFIHPGNEGVYTGMKSNPKDHQTLISYLEQEEVADPWVVPQVKVSGHWAHYGVVKLFDQKLRIWYNILLLDNNILSYFIPYKKIDGTYDFYDLRDKKRFKDVKFKPNFLFTYTELKVHKDIIGDFLMNTIMIKDRWFIYRTTSNMSPSEYRAPRQSRILISDKLNYNLKEMLAAQINSNMIDEKIKGKTDD